MPRGKRKRGRGSKARYIHKTIIPKGRFQKKSFRTKKAPGRAGKRGEKWVYGRPKGKTKTRIHKKLIPKKVMRRK